jgi:fructokinase
VMHAANPAALRILDINLRPPFWTPEIVRDSLALANVLKLNDEELPILAHVLGLDSTPDAFLSAVLDRFSLRLVALTRGANGAVLLSADGERSEQPGVPVAVVDTVGAGDAFTAALALGLTHQWPLDRTNRWASAVAAFVCTQLGATPTFPPEFRLTV